MRLKDPKAREDVDGRPDGYVDVGGDLVPVEGGEFEHPAITREWAERYAEREGVDVGVVLVDEPADGPADGSEGNPDTIGEAIDRGECPWCDDYEGDHVGQHASSAHPDAWDTYKD